MRLGRSEGVFASDPFSANHSLDREQVFGMSVYDEIMPWQEPSEISVKMDTAAQEAELAKQKAAQALMFATMEAAKIVYELMIGSDDEQVRLRAAEIIFSRTIPKVAAKHIEEVGDAIDSADVASLRESIIARIKGNGNGNA